MHFLKRCFPLDTRNPLIESNLRPMLDRLREKVKDLKMSKFLFFSFSFSFFFVILRDSVERRGSLIVSLDDSIPLGKVKPILILECASVTRNLASISQTNPIAHRAFSSIARYRVSKRRLLLRRQSLQERHTVSTGIELLPYGTRSAGATHKSPPSRREPLLKAIGDAPRVMRGEPEEHVLGYRMSGPSGRVPFSPRRF